MQRLGPLEADRSKHDRFVDSRMTSAHFFADVMVVS
jgi:hypothetical protein